MDTMLLLSSLWSTAVRKWFDPLLRGIPYDDITEERDAASRALISSFFFAPTITTTNKRASIITKVRPSGFVVMKSGVEKKP